MNKVPLIIGAMVNLFLCAVAGLVGLATAAWSHFTVSMVLLWIFLAVALKPTK